MPFEKCVWFKDQTISKLHICGSKFSTCINIQLYQLKLGLLLPHFSSNSDQTLCHCHSVNLTSGPEEGHLR